uniref:Xrn1 N-terminal domain-containing protein n=1 Tax=viral metagenome TaxID=1070528 RepID=A0A6C0ECP4_9ZZZZ
MGIDRFANFIAKSINNDAIEELSINNNIRKIIANHIIFDINFLIYQEIIEVENEINDIIKILLCIPSSLSKLNLIEQLLDEILNQNHWKKYNITTNLYTILDGVNEEIIINNFLNYINNKIVDPLFADSTILELVIYEKIINVMFEYINNIHHYDFILSLNIFFDGIPSLSKIIEQRRRRIKNYLESNEKKILFKNYFENLLLNNKNLFECLTNRKLVNMINFQLLSNVSFDYLKWIKCRHTIDKSIGPSSFFIKNLEKYMNVMIPNKLFKINFMINSSNENGESDLKIFKYISTNEIEGDYCIHTTDSDLIHQMLVQQIYYKLLNKDINISVIKYLKNYNYIGYVQIFEANLIIKNILELYNINNNIKSNNLKIIWDICFIFYLFGNDHLPSSYEIGPELGLEFFLKTHYMSINKNNIINIKKNIINIDFNNLVLYLEKINESNIYNITKILLHRFFKINIQIINLFIDKFKFDFNEILKFLKKFIIYKGLQLSSENFQNLYECDLRKIYINELNHNDIELYKNIKIFNFDMLNEKLFNNFEKLIEENIDYYEFEFTGLILYNKSINITKDSYQDIYNYLSDKATNNLNTLHSKFYDHISIYQHKKNIDNLSCKYDENIVNDYLKKLYHLTYTQFGSMKNYHTDNLTFYKYSHTPSLNYITVFINNILLIYNKQKIWLDEISNDNLEKNDYFNSINHHILISPFIKKYSFSNQINNIINDFDHIDNLWLTDINNFDYRNIDIKLFFKNWNKSYNKLLIDKNISN